VWAGYLHLKHYPISSVVAVRRKPEGVSPTDDVAWEELREQDVERGHIYVSDWVNEPFVWVTYEAEIADVPADIRAVATAMLASAVRLTSGEGMSAANGTPGPLKSYSLGGDIRMDFSTPSMNINTVAVSGLKLAVPDDVYYLLQQRRRHTIA